MSNGINKAILIVNLGADPDVRTLPSGDAVANVSLATSESWIDRNTGELHERTEWHRIALFGKVAEIAGDYLHKGSRVYVEGKLRTRKWMTLEVHERYTTEIIVDARGSMQMLDGRAVQEPAPAPKPDAWRKRAQSSASPRASRPHWLSCS